MNTVLETQLQALQACVVALAATVPPSSASLVRSLIGAAVADQGDRKVNEEADAAAAAVFAGFLNALPAADPPLTGKQQ